MRFQIKFGMTTEDGACRMTFFLRFLRILRAVFH